MAVESKPLDNQNFLTKKKQTIVNKRIQWNMWGVKVNFGELILLLILYGDAVFCLQGTFLKINSTMNIKIFALYNYINKHR